MYGAVCEIMCLLQQLVAGVHICGKYTMATPPHGVIGWHFPPPLSRKKETRCLLVASRSSTTSYLRYSLEMEGGGGCSCGCYLSLYKAAQMLV